MKRLAILRFLTLTLLVACSSETVPTPIPLPAAVPSQPVTATQPPGGTHAMEVASVTSPVQDADANRPPICSSTKVTQRITAFVDAFNRGDQQQLATFFSTRIGRIDGFSIADRKQGEAPFRLFYGDRRDQVLAYLADRHNQGEQWQLMDIASQYYEATRDLAHYSFAIRKSAADLLLDETDDQSNTTGKGSMNCGDLTLFVWAMSTSY